MIPTTGGPTNWDERGYWYLGLKGVYGDTEISLDIPGDNLPPGVEPGDLRLDFTLATLSPRLQYDTRDNEFYPEDGFLIDADVAISREAIGADADYEKYVLSLNNYFKLGQAGVLASRLNMSRTPMVSSVTSSSCSAITRNWSFLPSREMMSL